MRALLLVTAASLAAISLPVTSAKAGENSSSGSGPGGGFVSGGSSFHSGFDNRGRRNRDRGGDIYLGDWEYTGNQTWRSDSFNDWWHDRPDRAYPAWVRNNQNCERKWWGGESLRC